MADYRSMMGGILDSVGSALENSTQRMSQMSEDTVLKIGMGVGVAGLATNIAIPAMSVKKSFDEDRSLPSGALHLGGAVLAGNAARAVINGPGTLGVMTIASKIAKGV